VRKIHFIGVSGIGVSAVAMLSINSGYSVTGSAIERNHLVDNLEKIGMRFYLGHRKDNIGDVDLIVRSAAIKDDNPEVREAIRKKIDLIYYSRYLGMLMSEKKGIAIAGTHGKTTTTAMVATIMKHANLDPEVVCGGVMREFNSNAIYGKGEYFVAEACEYNRSFLDLQKRYAVITNIEAEHLDYYGNFDEVMNSFSDFIKNTEKPGYFVVNGNDKNVIDILDGHKKINIIKVGYGQDNDFIINSEEEIGGRFTYNLKTNNDSIYSTILERDLWIEPEISGRFNIINSALASVLTSKFGVSPECIEESLKNFKGTERRMETIGSFKGNPVLSDYAHHPTEISATLEAVKRTYNGRKVLAIFQPHQYSRTALFFDRFVESLSMADYLILTRIYKQRDSKKYIEMVDSKDLFNEVQKIKKKDVYYIENLYNVWDFIKDFVKSDSIVILFMGAGDIDKYARSYLF